MNDVSVIIVNYNTKEHLLKCLKALLEYAQHITYQIYVVDNGSTDGSCEAVREVYPSVNLVCNERNYGFAKAVNQGIIKSINSRYYFILNSDAIVTEGAIEKLVRFLDSKHLTGIVSGQLLNIDNSRQHSFDNFPNLLSELIGKGLLRIVLPHYYPSKKQLYTGPIEVDSLIGAAMLVRKQTIEDVGLLDENFFLFLEETDWCYRMRQKNWKVYFLPEVIIYHTQGQSKKSVLIKAKIEYLNSLYKFYRKHYSLISYILLRLIRPIRIMLGLFFYILGLILTFGLDKRCQGKFLVYSSLLLWHLMLCSEKMTLKG